MISLLLLILPFVLAALVLAGPRKGVAKLSAGLSALVLGISLYAYCAFTGGDASLFVVDQPWITNPSIKLKFTADGIALLMILLTNICIPFIHLSAANREVPNARGYHSLIFLMQAALTGVFLADDLLLYYIFWEITLIPAYFILLYWGGENRRRITVKFFLYTFFGSLMMMVAIIFLYANYAQGSVDSVTIFNLNIDKGEQNWMFIGFMLAFAIKLPLVPFHTWQADTYHMAPTQGTMLLSGLMAKMALFSIVRWLMPGFKDAVVLYAPYIIMLAVIGIVYASVIAIMQKDLKRTLAYASLAHISLMVAGVFSLSQTGMEAAFVQAFAHGINTIGLLICVSVIEQRLGTVEYERLGGIRHQAPWFTTAFFVMMFATVAAPLTNSFIAEVTVLYGVFEYSPVWAGLAALTLVFGAVYMIRLFRQTVLGPANPNTEGFKDLGGTEKLTIYPFVIMVFFFGLAYQPLFNLTETTVQKLIQHILIP